VIVADTNLLVGLYLPTAGSGIAEQVLDKDPAWAVPLLWRSEFRNVLATGMRSGRLAFDLALEMLEAAGGLVGDNEYAVPDERVLALAAASGCSAYDCEFVALAEGLNAWLVTSDRQVLKAFPERAVAPEVFVERGSS
jgi:predicted nucleic acid-binding protein